MKAGLALAQKLLASWPAKKRKEAFVAKARIKIIQRRATDLFEKMRLHSFIFASPHFSEAWICGDSAKTADKQEDNEVCLTF
jgi:hypothetical protein